MFIISKGICAWFVKCGFIYNNCMYVYIFSYVYNCGLISYWSQATVLFALLFTANHGHYFIAHCVHIWVVERTIKVVASMNENIFIVYVHAKCYWVHMKVDQ